MILAPAFALTPTLSQWERESSGALEVLARSRVDAEDFADFNERWYTDFQPRFEHGFFVLIGRGCAFDLRSGIGDGQLDDVGQIDSDDQALHELGHDALIAFQIEF